jgi:hypothetical protein
MRNLSETIVTVVFVKVGRWVVVVQKVFWTAVFRTEEVRWLLFSAGDGAMLSGNRLRVLYFDSPRRDMALMTLTHYQTILRGSSFLRNHHPERW